MDSIKEVLSVSEKDINGVLSLIKEEEMTSKINGCFYLIQATRDVVRENDLIKFIEKYVIQYCLQYSEYSKIAPSEAITLVKKAISKFVKGNNSGELGEVVLFCLLEAKLQAVQILNKMQLKTHPEMHYHGADAVHFGIDSKGYKTLYLGEAKMRKKFSKALSDALDSTSKLFENLESKKDFELDLIKSHIDSSKFGDMEDEILDYLNPYTTGKEDYNEVIAVFLGYSWDEIKNAESDDTIDPIWDYLTQKYKTEISKLVNKINTAIAKKAHLKNKRFSFFLIPFKCVETAKNNFVNKVKQI